MAKSKGDDIRVWLDDPAYGALQQIGTLSRGDKGIVRFSYDPAWLEHAHAFHLRNHGFIRSPAGWRLAPAFDMNPSFKREEHVLSLDLYNRQPDLDVVLSTASF